MIILYSMVEFYRGKEDGRGLTRQKAENQMERFQPVSGCRQNEKTVFFIAHF